jgi:CRISPR/Cas system-associated protein Cas7 (RAMP superfamily)
MSTKYTGTKDQVTEEQNKLKRHTVLNATPQQIENYIDTNVTDLASAKEVLKLIAKVAILKP